MQPAEYQKHHSDAMEAVLVNIRSPNSTPNPSTTPPSRLQYIFPPISRPVSVGWIARKVFLTAASCRIASEAVARATIKGQDMGDYQCRARLENEVIPLLVPAVTVMEDGTGRMRLRSGHLFDVYVVW